MPSRPSLPEAPPQPKGSKKLLYARLAQDWYLPPIRSTGVTLTYLRKVDAGQVFRVGLLDIQRFLAECKPDQLRRVPFVNKDQAYAKVNRLLLEKGQHTLGFGEGPWPDGEWLYRVARFVDPGNLCNLFEKAVSEVTPAQNDSTDVELGKRRVEEQLVKQLGWNDQPDVLQAISELRMSQQRASSRKAEMQRLLMNYHKMEAQVEKDRVTVEEKLERTVRVAMVGVKRSMAGMEGEQELQAARELATK